MSYANLLKIQP